MARKKKPAWEEEERRPQAAAFFAQQVGDREALLGRGDSVIEDDDVQLIFLGCPLRPVSLRYFYCNDVFPYGRVHEYTGLPGSCKSAHLFETYRWHLYNSTDLAPPEGGQHGGYSHQLAESRDSPDLRASICGQQFVSLFPPNQCEHVEDYQKGCTDWIKLAEANFDCHLVANVRYGAMPWSMCLGVDSLTAVTTRKEAEKTWEQGFADPAFSEVAKSLNLWMKVFPGKMRPWPVSLVAVNHLKQQKDKRGFWERRSPGGASIDFAATFKVRFELRDEVEHLDGSACVIRMHTEKNSLSTAGTKRHLDVRMRWSFDAQGRQHTVWDWHDATVELLLSFDSTRKKRIEEVVAIEAVDRTRRRASCPSLGISKGTFAEIGAAIADDPDIVAELDNMFGVRHRTPFRLGVPYHQQIEEFIASGQLERQKAIKKADAEASAEGEVNEFDKGEE